MFFGTSVPAAKARDFNEARCMRVSTIDQTTANQERELRQIAGNMGCEIVKVYKDHGIRGAKSRNGRPGFDSLCKAAARASSTW